MAPASSSAAPEPLPAPGSVKFECSPEPCTSLHCDGREYTDLTKFIELPPGEHRCIGGAEGYLPLIATFSLASKQELVQALELKKKAKLPEPPPERTERPTQPATARPPATRPAATRPPATRPPAASPCGTFINPCK
jgi:hypothetical protein